VDRGTGPRNELTSTGRAYLQYFTSVC
jgi:hypothetical protein